jgi:hypothetical protein
MAVDARTRRRFFLRNGYVRVPNAARREAEKSDYKKGWEVRLVARTEKEAERIAERARSLGFRPGNTFAKAGQFVVPLYGREAVEAFLAARGRALAPKPAAKRGRPKSATA